MQVMSVNTQKKKSAFSIDDDLWIQDNECNDEINDEEINRNDSNDSNSDNDGIEDNDNNNNKDVWYARCNLQLCVLQIAVVGPREN